MLVVIAAIVAFASTVGTAQADPKGSETCGGMLTNGTWLYQPTTAQWVDGYPPVEAYFACGTGKTFTWEVQHTTNGGQTVGDWWGSGNEPVHTSPAGCNGGCYAFMSHPGSCATTGSYRVVMNSNDTSYRSPWAGAGVVCDGHEHSGT